MILYEADIYLSQGNMVCLLDTKYYKSDKKLNLKDKVIIKPDYKLFYYITEYEKKRSN